MNHKLIELEWVDSGGYEGQVWHFKDELPELPSICTSVGYLVKKDKGYYYIAQSQNRDQWGRIFTIPTKAVIRKRVL